jgi:hypothetical protein
MQDSITLQEQWVKMYGRTLKFPDLFSVSAGFYWLY